MAAKKKNPDKQLNQTGQNLVRIVIASYFIAAALGIIPGTDATPLTALLLPEHYAEFSGKILIFTGAYLVLLGTWLRASALLLAITVFWSSFVQNAGIDLGAFWRDMALIGALILTYSNPLPRAQSRRLALRWLPRVRRLMPREYPAAQAVSLEQALRRDIAALDNNVLPRRVSKDAEPLSARTARPVVDWQPEATPEEKRRKLALVS